MNLAGQTCLVTGSSRGIGRGIAEDLARHGAAVAVNYRSSTAAAEDVVESIRSEDATATAVQADVSDLPAVESMREEVHDSLGPVDVLVNNAGITADRRFDKMTREEWDAVVDVNLGGVFNCTRTFYEDLQEAEHGRLVNVSSVVGQIGNIGQANYATTKSGVTGFTRTLALELAPSGSTANCVAPGFVRTDMFDGVPEQVQEKILEDVPLDRFARVEDIAPVVRFVASPESRYMTGQIIGVNGGIRC